MIQSYSAQPLADLLARFATGEPVPGGGPAAGLAAALGTSLVIMAANLARTRLGAADDAAALASTITRLGSLNGRLLALADDDSVAYAAVLTAYRQPKGTAEEKAARAAAIQLAMQAATDVPLAMMQSCEQVLREAVLVAEQVPASASIDLAVGVELLDAALRGCGMCVTANAGALTAAERRDRCIAERGRIAAAATGHLERIRTTQTARR